MESRSRRVARGSSVSLAALVENGVDRVISLREFNAVVAVVAIAVSVTIVDGLRQPLAHRVIYESLQPLGALPLGATLLRPLLSASPMEGHSQSPSRERSTNSSLV